VALESFAFPPTVSVHYGRYKDQVIDVSHSHLFLGYKPVIIALMFSASHPQLNSLESETSVCLEFNQDGFYEKKPIATLTLSRIHKQVHKDVTILFYEGSRGSHRYLNSLHQSINNQIERIKTRKPGNIGLPGNEVDQVRIAYSLPRLISVITVSDGVLMNMFPTDLHGQASEEIYVSSLREGGLANAQVQRIKKIVISEIQPSWFKQTYAWGKNHMSEMRSELNFSLHKEKSKSFGFPLPEGVTKYREVELMHSWRHGIHWIHHYQIVNQKRIGSSYTLAHIHQYYAQWRKNHNIKTEYFWR
jgi:hypothetical protein